MISLRGQDGQESARDEREASPYPLRFQGAPERGRRIGKTLRRVAGVKHIDEELIDLLGRRLYARDEPGAELVHAMRADAAVDGERVTMAQFRKALDEGITSLPAAPAGLVRFFELVDSIPDWVDFELLERGAGVVRRMGRTTTDVLLQLALIGGYRFGGPADLLVATGGLAGSSAMRRLGETETWTHAIARPGAMRRDGEGFKLTVHVRVMHALINNRFEADGRWDVDRWGLPINQTDQAGTLGLFNSTLLLGGRVLGRWVGAEDSRAVMHLWKYVGWLLGVNEDWLFDTEREQNVFNYHMLLTQDSQTSAGGALAAAIVDGEGRLDHGRLNSLRAPYARARLLSMLRYFLGKEGMEDLCLPVTPPWAVPPAVAKNLVASLVVARSERGRRYLEDADARFKRKRQHMLFEGAREQIGALPL